MLPLDNRKEPRKETLIAAFASNLDDTLGVKCTIREVSRGGCRLVSTELGDLPEIIHIVPEGFEKPLLGKIIWRDKKMAGVKFIDEVEKRRRKIETPKKKKPLGFLRRFQIFSSDSVPRSKPKLAADAASQTDQQDDLVATVTHELRTPLTSLLGSLGLLVNGALGKLPEKVQSVVGMAFRNAGRLSSLVDDLLDAKKAKSGKLKFSFVQSDIVALVRKTVAANEAYGAKYGVRFLIEDKVGKEMVRMDPSRIEQVLANLLSNAAKFSPSGKPVMVALRRSDNKIRVSISDEGEGLPDDMHDRIFERYEQAEQPAGRDSEGTGLGLPISQMIAEKHGSRIHVSSKPGAGATFWFELASAQDGAAGVTHELDC